MFTLLTISVLTAGALETRTYGKRIVWQLKQFLSNRADFDRLLSMATDSQAKRIYDVIEGSNGPPPPPSRGVTGPRSYSRQPSGGSTTGGILSGMALQV